MEFPTLNITNNKIVMPELSYAAKSHLKKYLKWDLDQYDIKL